MLMKPLMTVTKDLRGISLGTFKLLLSVLLPAGFMTAAPAVVGVQNAADFSTRLCPGVIAVVYGSNFGSGPASSVTVTVSGKAAYVETVTPSQITLQLPVDASPGSNSLVVTTGGASSSPFAISLDAYAPTIFSADGSGSGAGLIRNTSNVSITTTAPSKPSDSLVLYGIGLGPTNPTLPTGASAAGQAPTTAQPTVMVGGKTADVSYAGASPGVVGLYQINFTVPAGLQGTQQVTISIGGKTSSPVTLALGGITSMVNNASFGSAGTISPGSIATLFANGLGTTNQTIGFPATGFQGVSVTLNGIPAPLFHLVATSGQIDLLVPYELPVSGTVAVQLHTSSGTSQTYNVTMAPASQGLYYIADPSTSTRFNALAELNGTAWLVMPDSMAAALKLPGNCKANGYDVASLCGQPATAGDYLVLFVTGLGKATPNGDPNGMQLKTGDIPPADGSVLYQTVAKPSVTVGGLPANVVFSGIAPGFPGLYQIDFQVPAGVTGNDVPVTVSIGGSPVDTRTIALR